MPAPIPRFNRDLRSEGRILNTGGGNNVACDLNFIPRMDATRLVAGYRSVMKRIYSHEAYYERVKLLLSRSRPTSTGRLTFANLRALMSSIVRQGIIGRGRISYWKLMLTTAIRHPRSFGVAMTLAVKGLSLPDHDPAPDATNRGRTELAISVFADR